MSQVKSEFALALNQICAERGIDPKVVIESIKQAILAALKRDLGVAEEEVLVGYAVSVNEDTGAIAVEKDGQDATPAGFGRIAAQVAKQVIMQRVREAEKDAIITEYQDKIGTLVTGMILRFDGPNVVVDIGRGQAIMPLTETITNEFYRLNQRVAVYIKEIRDTYKGQAIIVSRSAPELVQELFAREVPEVGSKSVEIVAIARESGHRTKIAVKSNEDGVDPVGSCVGQKGVRVQAVINELNGEKIDIVEYSDNLAEFVKSALAPAEGLDVKIDDKKRKVTVTVPDDQLSLAIGRGGQNARLAAKLTGYKIDIKGETIKDTVTVTGTEDFEIDQLGLGSKVRNTLLDLKITTIKALEEKLPSLKDQLTELDPRAFEETGKAITRWYKKQNMAREEAEKMAHYLADRAAESK
ncbi:MAG: NusA antitermination factor [Microgenomates group bacterium GW2011_GWC1_46_16]|uniref:Transcription termination/antitermination protein NusA n=2 Tax=Candidatus Collieribacteriota TaxID=1752725 RepID=A0A1F5G0B3_9BACT|nr:MAG: NusA antitermination factor [Microgenomates group bacterium GW2011_GWF1_46_12]KKU26925.1 MAG: NusA antitermination factor [Microgenomates group bacterium GW2011_GWC1_46_16]KKU28342.1 MAG: NusA antitermination factor [Microgenomates group bacterium GW2011_GWF2_46_18]KKU45197.1 MAG: NusA antitermination factor [Microgenomates group bacterium GW2011_GWB1_46_7]KKU62159.1 MAG: NusA antitermination factor [Microgenomates group bacterium GW2011_GWE1_47_12]KKU62306.1 MAG: NusA antitermination 